MLLKLEFLTQSLKGTQIIDKALSTDVTPFSSFGHIVKDTKSIASSLVNFSFSHTRRQGNSVTHALFRRARFSFHLLVWMESVPLDVSKFL